MRSNPQIWFPAGEAAGEDARSGRGAFTKRHLSVQYAPPGDSEQPAVTISHLPLDTSGLDVPAMKIDAGEYSQGDALLIEKFNETGAFVTGELGGADIFSVEGDGDMWNLGTMYAHKANVGGIVAAADGTVALDMTQGNVFTVTTSQNTSYSTSAPTNGIGGELAAFVVDNSGGYTVAWAAGFTDVDSIGAGDTGIHTRLLQFDGTTWHQITACEDGVVINVGDDFILVKVNNPNAVQSDDNEQVIWDETPAALTISKITVTLNASGNEVAGDLKYADTFIGLASPVVINAFDTTSGVLSDDTITSGAVPAGKALYLAFDLPPSVNITQMMMTIYFTWD